MHYLIIDKENFPKLEKCWGIELRVLKSNIIKDNYILVVISGKLEIIAGFLRTENIKARLLIPYINTRVFEEIFGEATAHQWNLKPVFLSKQTLLQSILAAEKNLRVASNLYYYVGAKSQDEVIESINFIEVINHQLKTRDLLIPEHDILLHQRDIFLEVVNKTLEKKLKKGVSLMDELKSQEEDFFLNCIADYILLASEKYTKEEIENYLRTELLVELDRRGKK